MLKQCAEAVYDGNMKQHRLVWREALEERDLGDGLVWRKHPDDVYSMEHLCKVIRSEEGEEEQLVIAPTLDDHDVDWERGSVSPSIACPDCGLHGFIRNGKWIAA